MAISVNCRSEIEFAQTPLGWMEGGRSFLVRRVISEARSPEEKSFLVETETKERYLLRYRSNGDTWNVILEDKKGNTSL